MSNSADPTGATCSSRPDLHSPSDRIQPVLDHLDFVDIDELTSRTSGTAAWLRSGLPNMIPTFAQLVKKMTEQFDLRSPRQLAQCLRHQACLQPHMGVTHLAFDLGLGHQRRDGVNHDHVDRPRPDRTSTISRACSPVTLADQQIVDSPRSSTRVERVECSASTKAATPPSFWASATRRARVVFEGLGP